MTENERFQDYLSQLRKPFHKLCRLRFLQPDGSTAFSLDNNPRNRRYDTFLSDGTLTVNRQNGRRRNVSVKLVNLNGEYDYNVNSLWFGTEIALDEGLLLSDGSEFYIQQGVFLPTEPVETLLPAERFAEYRMADKSAALDGTLGGELQATYKVPENTNIFEPILSLLRQDKGNGQPYDRVTPVFTEWYNDKTQLLPKVNSTDPDVYRALTQTPYELVIDALDGTVWDVVEGLALMLNAWIFYDQTGALRLEPSQDDILDADKPILWQFSLEDATLLGPTYTVKNSEVYNDYIVLGEMLSDKYQPAGRAQNWDPKSPVNISAIGRRTKRVSAVGYGTDRMCQDRAVWELKRASVLQRSVSISCSQLLHIREDTLVTIARTDKPGSPVERHLVQGFSRPLASAAPMTINATSVLDLPNATLAELPGD